jgi:glycosyltransferase involved in cell wall biosynthesis
VLHTQSGLAGVEELRPLAEKLQRQGRLRIHHQTVPAPGLYHLGDVYVYPSRLDGIGLTVPEALACGLPVIVPDEPPMNEFPGAGCGTLVPVAARRERSDAYYWPMCEVAVDRLAAAMQASVERAAGLSQAKLAARARAEACLNWMENSRELLARLAAATPLPQAAKAGAIAQALEFERRRSRESVRFWLSCHAPQAVRIARRAYRALRREPR